MRRLVKYIIGSMEGRDADTSVSLRFLMPYALCLMPFLSYSQHYQFTQFYSAPTYLNPAFTGANSCSRVSMTYRDQWPSIPGAFVTYQVSYDHFFVKYNSGAGIQFFNDKSGQGGLSTTAVTLLYAYEINVNRKLVCRFGAQAGFVQRSINFGNLLFGDQVARGGAATSVENQTQSKIYPDFSAGGLGFTKQSWFGAAASHFTQPNQSLLNDKSPLPMEVKMHCGRKFFFKEEDKRDAKKYLIAAFNYKFQNKFDQADIGFYYARLPLILGVWYRGIPLFKAYKPGYGNNDAIAVLAGINWNRFNLGYSYDFTISKLTMRSGGSNELSLFYDLCDPKKNKKKKAVTIACPKF